MFNRKQQRINWLQQLLRRSTERQFEMHKAMECAEERERSMRALIEELNKTHADDLKTIEDMTKERDHALALAVDNGKKLDELMMTNSELNRQRREADAKIKKQKHLLDEARRATECPADCKNRKNTNACRTCTRYQHAKDKYEVLA